MRKGGYYKWKKDKKIWKAPWVIKYYESVTDENQYDLGHVVNTRLAWITGVLLFLYGLMIGVILLVYL